MFFVFGVFAIIFRIAPPYSCRPSISRSYSTTSAFAAFISAVVFPTTDGASSHASNRHNSAFSRSSTDG